MMKSYQHIIFLTSFLLLSCELDNIEEVETTSTSPVIVEGTITPNFINLATLPQSTQEVDTTILLLVKLDKAYAENINVSYGVKNADGSTIASGQLQDDGVSPDQKKLDGIYSANYRFQFPKASIGVYTITLLAQSSSNEQSVHLMSPLTVFNSANNHPELFNLFAPDTVFVPTGSTPYLIKVSVTAADSQGLSDIVSVSLRSVRPDSSVVGTYPLFDDGSIAVRSVFNLTSGDTLSGDGRYTLTIPLFSSTTRNTYRDFIFTSIDRSNATSNTLTKRVYIK